MRKSQAPILLNENSTEKEVQRIVKQKLCIQDVEFLIENNHYCQNKLGFHPDKTAKTIADFAVDIASALHEFSTYHEGVINDSLEKVITSIGRLPEPMGFTTNGEIQYVELLGQICQTSGLDPFMAARKLFGEESELMNFFQEKNKDKTTQQLLSELKQLIQNGNNNIEETIFMLKTHLHEIKISTTNSYNLTPLHFAIRCGQEKLAKKLYKLSPKQAEQPVKNFKSNEYEELHLLMAREEIKFLRQETFNIGKVQHLFHEFNQKNYASNAQTHVLSYIEENIAQICQNHEFALEILCYLSTKPESSLYIFLKTQLLQDDFAKFFLEEIVNLETSSFCNLIKDDEIQKLIPVKTLCAIIKNNHPNNTTTCTITSQILANKLNELEEFHQSFKIAITYCKKNDVLKYANSCHGLELAKSFSNEELKNLGKEKSALIINPVRQKVTEYKAKIIKHPKQINKNLATKINRFPSSITHMEIFEVMSEIDKILNKTPEIPKEGKKARQKRLAAEKKAREEEKAHLKQDINSKEEKEDLAPLKSEEEISKPSQTSLPSQSFKTKPEIDVSLNIAAISPAKEQLTTKNKENEKNSTKQDIEPQKNKAEIREQPKTDIYDTFDEQMHSMVDLLLSDDPSESKVTTSII